MSRPFNPWTRDEESRLLASSTSGVPLKTIALQHDRTPNAIRLRLERITLNHILGGKSVAEATKLTGLPMKQVQMSEKTDSGRAPSVTVHPMFSNKLSRNDLKSLHDDRKSRDIAAVVERIAGNYVVPAAEKNSTRVTMSQPQYDGMLRTIAPYPLYLPTLGELVAPLRTKFPGVDVNFTEELTDAGQGMYRKTQMLVIDWS